MSRNGKKRKELRNMMLEWHNTEDKLPKVGRDIIGYNADTDDLELGFMSDIDNEETNYWADFTFPVTHWAYINLDNIVPESNKEQKAAIQMGRVFADEREKELAGDIKYAIDTGLWLAFCLDDILTEENLYGKFKIKNDIKEFIEALLSLQKKYSL